MRILLFLLFIACAGCTGCCKTVVKEVYIKTGCVKPPTVVVPLLKSDALTDKSSDMETIEAYVLDVNTLKSYSGSLSKALLPYNSCQ